MRHREHSRQQLRKREAISFYSFYIEIASLPRKKPIRGVRNDGGLQFVISPCAPLFSGVLSLRRTKTTFDSVFNIKKQINVRHPLP